MSLLGFGSETTWETKRGIPALREAITDEVGWFSSRDKSKLDGLLSQVFRDTGVQMAVYIIPSLEGEILESYSLAVAEKWKLGNADTDKGLLLLVAVKERKLRLEVGQGLEGDIPDARASQIIGRDIVPQFKKGRFVAGVQSAIASVLSYAVPDYKAPASIRKRQSRGSKSSLYKIIEFIAIIAFLLIFRNSPLALLFLGSGGLGGGRRGGGFGGGGFSGGGGGFSGGGSSGGW